MSALLVLFAAIFLGSASPASLRSTNPTAVVTVQDSLGKLKTQLTDTDTRKRREAVQGLIELGSETAWSLVIDSLADPVGQVADEAQLGLVALPEGLHKELLGKRGLLSKRELVAVRVAELLGRLPAAFPEKAYLKALGGKDADVRRSVLWSIERLAKNGLLDSGATELLKKIGKLARKDKAPAVRAHALLTLAELDAKLGAAAAEQQMGNKAPEVRVAVMCLAGLVDAFLQPIYLGRGAADSNLSVRLQAYETGAELGTKNSLGVLVEALASEPRASAAWRIVDLLRSKTGMKYGRDVRPWRDWFKAQASDWKPVNEKSEGEVGDSGTAALVGMRVISSHVSFLVDFSGSMWQEQDGVSRKQWADAEMRKALEGLSPEVMFNVHPYATVSKPWKDKLMPAKRSNVKAATGFFDSCTLQGKGDFWSAMQLALQDPDVDTLMMLGDGAPSGGSRWNVELMKELFAHENRFRKSR
jgi:hypothetical protein